MDFEIGNLKIPLTEEQMPLFIADLELFNAIIGQLPLSDEAGNFVIRKFYEHVEKKYGKNPEQKKK
jgi:hypothetical protein